MYLNSFNIMLLLPRKFYFISLGLVIFLSACGVELVQEVPSKDAGFVSEQTAPRTEYQLVDQDSINKPTEMDLSKLAAENRITMDTNYGKIVLRLYPDKTPNTVKSFAELAGKGFYDGLTFHRVIKSFMLQGGDPRGDGTGGPGYRFGDEFVPGLSNVKGTISMANAGPNTNGSQFFINTVNNNFLDGRHSVFGEVVEGLVVVQKIADVATGAGDKPVEPVTMTKVAVSADLLAWAKSFAWTVPFSQD